MQKKQQFLVYFMHMKDLRMGSTIELSFKLWAFKKLLAYPQWTLGVPLVEHCWTRRYVFVSLRWSFNRSVSLSICMSLSKVLSVCVLASLFDCLNNFFLLLLLFCIYSLISVLYLYLRLLLEVGTPITSFFIILFISTWHPNITNNEIVIKSVVWNRGDESFQKIAILGLDVGSNPGPLAPEPCVLPMRHSTSTITFYFYFLPFYFNQSIYKYWYYM